jgi:hypothetical protein
MATQHPWRICPLGEHWRKPHPKKGTKGVRGHCVKNPSKKDQLYSDEIYDMAEKYFSKLKGSPSKQTLGYSQGNKFDELIRGWCTYWNEIFSSSNPLDPNLVKALIATESGFRAGIKIKDGKGQGHATGLMQITDTTQEILGDENGELKDHYVHVEQKELTNPCLNIAAGVRWLFRKREIISTKLHREASWEETVVFYKGYKSLNHPQMKKLHDLYQRLK